MRRLSSSWTWFYKFVFPPLWIGGFGFAAVLLLQDPQAAHSTQDTGNPGLIFLVMLIAVSLLMYATCMRFKYVELDNSELVISNYRDTIRVPLRDIESVWASRMINPEIMSLRFRTPTQFGTRIIFMPPMRFQLGFTQHPLAKELEEMVRRAQGAVAGNL